MTKKDKSKNLNKIDIVVTIKESINYDCDWGIQD